MGSSPPFLFFALGAFYLIFITPGDRPLFLNIVYAVGVGLVGAYIPVLMLRNKIQKRQRSIKKRCRARPALRAAMWPRRSWKPALNA